MRTAIGRVAGRSERSTSEPCASQLGGYREFAAPRDLEDIAAGLWEHVTPFGPAAAPTATHRVIPHFNVSLSLERTRHPDGRLMSQRLLFLGPVAEPSLYRLVPGREMVSLRVRPEFSQAPGILSSNLNIKCLAKGDGIGKRGDRYNDWDRFLALKFGASR